MIKVHTHTNAGMFNLIKWNSDSAKLKTNYGDHFWVILTEIKCLAGGNWNKDIPEYRKKRLLSDIERRKHKKYIYDTHLKKIY